MKILELRLRAFGPFRDEQQVDFTAFDDDRLFLITGRTGAGKSSVLDAIVFALFNKVPRSTFAQDWKGVRSHYADPSVRTEVMLEFAHDGERFRVTRLPEHERPKARGEGFTIDKPEATLERWQNSAWVGVASGVKSVGQALADIVPLSADEFLQVALLAQNQFQAFLQAPSQKRQELLARLFDTRDYRAISERIDSWRCDAQLRNAEARSTFEHYIAQLDEQLHELTELDARLRRELEPASSPSEDLATALPLSEGLLTHAGVDGKNRDEVHDDGDSCEAVTHPDADVPSSPHVDAEQEARKLGYEPWSLPGSHQTLTAADRQQLDVCNADLIAFTAHVRALEAQLDLKRDAERAAERAASARSRLARAEDEASQLHAHEQHHADRLRELTSARAAAALVPHRDALTRAEQQFASAQHDQAAAEQGLRNEIAALEAYSEVTHDLTVLASTLLHETSTEFEADVMPCLERTRTEVQTQIDLVNEVTALENELAAHESAINSLTDSITARAPEREALPGQVAQLSASLESEMKLAARSDSLAHEIEVAEARHAAILAMPEANATVQQRSADYLAAQQSLAAREVEHSEVLRLFLASSASRLAEELADNDPCPVCGSREHPAPAKGTGEEVPATQDDLNRCEDAVRRAREGVTAAKDSYARAQNALDLLNSKAEGLDEPASTSALTTLRAQLDRAHEARQAVGSLREQLNDLASRERQLVEDHLRDEHARKTREAERERVTRELEELHERLPEDDGAPLPRILDALDAFHRGLQVFERARFAYDQAHQRLNEETSAFNKALAASDFADLEELTTAIRPSHVLEALQRQITEHEAAWARVQEVLSDAELRRDAASTLLEPAQANDERSKLEQRLREVSSLHLQFQDRVGQAKRLGARLDEHIASSLEHAKVVERLTRLDQDLRGTSQRERTMGLESYVLAAELDEIIQAANARLHEMSSGRYELQHDDEQHGRGRFGLGIQVFDAYTGRSRSAASLSGGETFLASLALALGLADVVSLRAGGLGLDTLFIDEGFGSLDHETLETAMRVLDDLRQGGRTVGVISHVTTMHEQIPAQLEVVVTRSGDSMIKPPRLGAMPA